MKILQISKQVMLKNDYLVAKIGVDTAENEPSKVGWSSRERGALAARARDFRAETHHPAPSLAQQPCRGLRCGPRCGRPRRLERRDLEISLLRLSSNCNLRQSFLGCINADFGNQLLIFQH